MRSLCIVFFVFFGTTLSAQAQNLSVEMAADHIDVTVGFTGSSIQVFGDRRDIKTDVAIFVVGPEKTITVWQKVNAFGAWVNRHFVKFRHQPGYYNYAASFDEGKGQDYAVLMKENRIGIQALFEGADIRSSVSVGAHERFKQALVEQKQKKGIYPLKPAEIKFMNEHFFRVSFDIPPAAPIGEYKIHSFLIKKGKVIEADIDVLRVEQVGVNASILYFAKQHAFLYAIFCIVIAAVSGWFVSVLRVRP